MTPLSFTFVVLFAYLIGLKGISLFALSKGKKTTNDYFLSGGSIGLLALTGTTMASLLSTGTVVSNPPNFYKAGTEYFWVIFFTLFVVLVPTFGLRSWKLSKRYGYITPGQMMSDLYQSRRVQLVFAVVGLACLVPYAMAQLVAIGKLFVGLTQGTIAYEWGVVIAGIVMAVFLIAGARAVIWTDVIQGFLFTGLLAAAAVMAVQWSGGWDTVTSNLAAAKPEHLDYREVSSWRLIEITLILPGLFALPYVWQRMFMAHSARDLSRMTLVIPPIFLIIVFSCWVIGSATHTLYPNGLEHPDGLLGTLFADHAPYFGAFILVAAFSAGISSVDSQLLTAASLITKDLRTVRYASEEDEFSMSRKLTLGILLVVVTVALFMQNKNLIELILIGMYVSSAFVPALVATFYWPRTSEAAVFYSVCVGAVGLSIRLFIPAAEEWIPQAGLASWCVFPAAATVIIVTWLKPCTRIDPRRLEPV